jgi:hypothetical protein
MDLGEPLLTLVQVSDLHVGRFDAVGDAEDNAVCAQLFAQHPWFDGFMGHHATGLKALQAFLATLPDDAPRLLMSGDATRFGHTNSFQNADDYLAASVMLQGLPYGLGVHDWARNAIPGNHDHWPGTARIVGGPNAAALARHFTRATPDVIELRLLDDQVPLRIGIINTDDEVKPKGFRRLRAIGHFPNQLDGLRAMLGPPEEADRPEIRVLMMHHSPATHQGTTGISAASMTKLRPFVADMQIRVILTGHQHQGLIDHNACGIAGVVECRSGTTTQMEYARPSWIRACLHLQGRRVAHNGLFVHRLYEHRGRITWDAQCYVRSKKGFDPSGLKHAFNVL